MVYRREPLEALCVSCADREGIRYRPSVAWERAWARDPRERARRRRNRPLLDAGPGARR